jgi:hypothetical protein
MSKATYRVTIASGKGETLAVAFTPHPEIVRILHKQWSDKVLSWRKSGAYRLETVKVEPMDFLAGGISEGGIH